MSNFDVYKKGQSQDPGSLVSAGGISSVSATGGAYSSETRTYYVAAGTGGGADDVLLDALASKSYVLNVKFIPLVGAGSSTVQAFTAISSGGTQVSSALASVTAGTIAASTTVPSAALAAATSLYLHRSVNTVAGIVEVVVIATV